MKANITVRLYHFASTFIQIQIRSKFIRVETDKIQKFYFFNQLLSLKINRTFDNIRIN